MDGNEIARKVAEALPAHIEVTIRFNVALGAVDKLDGPLANPALMYGILEMAREAYDVHRANTIKRQTATVHTGPGGIVV